MTRRVRSGAALADARPASVLAASVLLATGLLGACRGPALPTPPRQPPAPATPTISTPPLAATPAVTAAAAAPAPAPAPSAARFAVAADCEAAANLAIETLAQGGSAADAAIVALLAAGVAQPVSSGLGGGGMALYWDAETASATVIDFRETAPIGLRPGELRRRPMPDKQRGALVGVPGEAAGIAELHRRWGVLPLGELFGSAADLAERGFVVSRHLHHALHWRAQWFTESAALAPILAPSGKLLEAGEVARNPALGATLRRLATEGPLSFYRGAIGADVIATAKAAGGRLVPSDLAGYQVVPREPLRADFAGHVVLTAPPPSGGGLLLVETLRMHPPEALRDLGFDSGAYLHVLAETFRGAIADRVRSVGDPSFFRTDAAALTAPARLARRRAAIALDRTHRPEELALGDRGTSQLVVVDAKGDVASVTSSIGGLFGAGLVTRGGFVLNDTLGDFTDERSEQRFKARLRPNVPRGGARPATSMAPTIVLSGQSPVLALGGSGGHDIPTAVTQVLLGRVLFGLGPTEAVTLGRMRTPPEGGLLLEPGADAALVADLRARGEVVRSDRPDFSAVALVALGQQEQRRALWPATDARKGGAALVR